MGINGSDAVATGLGTNGGDLVPAGSGRSGTDGVPANTSAWATENPVGLGDLSCDKSTKALGASNGSSSSSYS